jgi:hypothetical protein
MKSPQTLFCDFEHFKHISKIDEELEHFRVFTSFFLSANFS